MTIENGKAADDMASEGPRGPRGRTRADRIRRLIRYTGVNLVSLALDYAVFLSLTHAYDIPVIASMVAYAIAFALNYKLSRRYVFGDDGSHKSEKRLFTEFMASGAFGLVLTAVVTGAGVHLLDLAPAIAKTAAVLICFVALYLIRSRLVFTRLE